MRTLASILGFAILSTLFSTRVYCAEKPEVTNVRVYIVDGGQIKVENMGSFSDTGELDGKSGTVNDICVLVGHPKGWLLWDTGLRPQKQGMFNFTLKKTIPVQLAEIGLKPKDINYLAFSHFHLDHTGNANDFAQSTWILQNKEWQWANAKPTPFGVEPSTFSQADKVNKKFIDWDYDVFGDDKVKTLFTPGHTPGHQVLLVKLDSGKNLIFSGDLYHQSISREKRFVPLFNFSRADTLASIDRIERIAKNLNATFVIQHEAHGSDKLPVFPEYLR